MSAPAEEPAVDTTTENKPADDSNTKTETAKDNADNQNNNKPIKKVKSKKDLKNDPSRFDTPGVNFNAKLIGIDDVSNARGDKMCQEAMCRLKVAVKQSGQHKQKIIINVSLDGIRIIDVRTHATNHTHPVHRISFISRDITDARAFGYVYGAGEGKHKFFAIKTEKAAEALVLTLRDLFQVVYEYKKKEVEDAKHKIEEPAPESGTEVKESQEPVYQVPQNGKPVENGTDPTYQVPSNNQPVQSEGPDLLQMETELETIERRIEQIDTMEELFKELEAPPTTSQTTPAAPASGSNAWASDLASLSQGMPQTQTQPMFSVGGAAFPPGQHFQPTSSALPGGGQPFSQGGQPFGQGGQPFGQGGQPFGAAGQPFGGQPTGQFGAVPQQQPAPFGQPNPFQSQPPNVPPRTGMGFPGVNFPGTGNFPPTPFPGTQQQGPAFPGVPPRPGAQPAVSITPANDPFGNDPFASNTAFEEGVLEPAKLETLSEESLISQPGKVDVFGDLVNIGGKTKASTPKDMFAELAAPEKKSLNELKVDKSPSPQPASPVGFQASGDSAATDPFGNTENPFGTSDPFANDPFASNSIGTSQASAQPSTHQDALFGGNFFGDAHDDDDAFNIPLPQGPPPPLPENIASQNLNLNPLSGPLPPPRPSVNTPPLPVHNPPLPPRPKSTSSDSTKSTSSLNSLTESQNVSQQSTPPLPPRPKSNIDTKVVPRPRPRASLLKTSPKTETLSLSLTGNTHTDKAPIVKPTETVINRVTDSINEHAINCVKSSDSDTSVEQKQKISQSAIKDKTLQKESHKSVTSDKPEIMHRTSSTVADPFISTDPFATEDPFTQSDPFANDPFASDPFADSSNTQPASKDDPFTTVVTSPHTHTDADPFSVFDNTLSNDSAFKFERSSSKKGKVKVSGQ